jgi:hypothetical protein
MSGGYRFMLMSECHELCRRSLLGSGLVPLLLARESRSAIRELLPSAKRRSPPP